MSSPDSSDSEIVDTSMQESIQANKLTKIRPKIDSKKSDSDSEDENLFRPKQKPRAGRIMSDSESDSEKSACEEQEEEEDEEDRIFGARTRYSITGIRPKDLPSSDEDSDEDFMSDSMEKSEVTATSSTSVNTKSITGARSENIQSSDEDSDGELNSQHEEISEIMETSIVNLTENPADQKSATSHHSKDLPYSDRSSAEESMSQRVDDSEIMDTSVVDNLAENLVNLSCREEPLSTEIQEFVTEMETSYLGVAQSAADQSTELHTINNESGGFEPAELTDQSMEQKIADTTPLREKIVPSAYTPRMSFNRSIAEKLSSTNYRESAGCIEILSSDDDAEENVKAKVQPKITELLKNSDVIDLDSPKKLVSRSFYQREESRLNSLMNQLGILKSLYETKSSLMSDKGAGLLKKQTGIESEVDKLKQNLAKLEVDESVDDSARNKIVSSFDGNQLKSVKAVPELSWDALKKITDQVQPLYTGARGIQTFENQKALTLDCLKDLHAQNQNMPTEDMRHPDPKNLKTALMPHQKYALSWMKWRERQKPRGGILADDMGLGKTLSMIALVLASIEGRQEKPEQSSDSDDDEDKENSKWIAKGRNSFHHGGTLIVCPASLTGQWQNEIETRVKRHFLSVLVHHGPKRETKARYLAKYDVVITTYNLISIEHKSGSATAGVKWNRIILDEGHTVRNHKSQTSIAVSELKGRYRWVLTGTPIQNKELDMFALLKFLQCSPFDEFTYWKKWIDNKSAGGQARLSALMKTLLLRRTKQLLIESGALTDMPSKRIDLIEVKLDTEELTVYQKVMLFSQHLFAEYLHQKEAKRDSDYVRVQNAESKAKIAKLHQQFRKKFGHQEIKSHVILVLLLRLRQVCCHPGLIDAMLEDADKSSMDVSMAGNNDLNLVEQLDQIQMMESVADDDDDAHESNKASSKALLRSNPVFKFDRPSAKIRKCLELLDKLIFRTEDKAVVVSQWPTYLEILGNFLAKRNVLFCKLTGTVPVHKRNEIVVDFNRPKGGAKIMLLSLTAGGVGLNLIGGNHLFLMDLHWNPQLEAQAQDRVYRVGQKKPVVIHKLMCVDTIEQRIKGLQDKKLEVANNVLTGARDNASKLTIADLQSLFEL